MEKGASIDAYARRVAAVLNARRPRSALVFLAKGAGFTVRAAVDALDAAGVAAAPLHGELNLDKRAVRAAPPGPTDLREVLDAGHGRVQARFRDAAAGDQPGADAPVLVTFEDSARGLHFDAVDAVVVVGLPATAASYLHVAGRTGRRFGDEVRAGVVVSVVPPKAVAILESWATQLGGVAFAPLDEDEDEDAAPPAPAPAPAPTAAP